MERDIHISLKDLLSFALRGAPVALAVALIVGLGVYRYRESAPAVYEATATLYAAENGLDLRSVGLSYVTAPSLHVDAYRAAMTSDRVANGTYAHLGVSTPTPDQIDRVREDVQARTDVDSRLIHVDAHAGTATEAADLATAVAEAMVAWDRNRAAANLDQIVTIHEERIEALDHQIASLQAIEDPGAGAQIDGLALLRAEQQTQLNYAITLAQSVVGLLEVVRPAVTPADPIAPTPTFDAALAALLAIAAVYAILLGRRTMDTHAQGVAELSDATGLPVLASYPRIRRGRNDLPTQATDFLRTTLLSTTSGERPRVLMVASPNRMDGKTTVAANLAESFAKCGYRTLLVDADMHRPAIAARYGIVRNRRSSLADVLRAPDESHPPVIIPLNQQRAVHTVPTFEGVERASELLNQHFEAALERWTRDYQVVIVDTPPLLVMADALAIGRYCTGVVMVVNHRRTDRRELGSAIDLLESNHAHVLGLVATHVRRGDQPYRRRPRRRAAVEAAASDATVRPIP